MRNAVAERSPGPIASLAGWVAGEIVEVKAHRAGQIDPGHGFGAEALRCAIGKRWRPALDRNGKPVPATAIVRVRFTR